LSVQLHGAHRVLICCTQQYAFNGRKTELSRKCGHSIGAVKRVFGFAKFRYCGLHKNAHRLLVTCALANLFIARRHLLCGQPV
jgi:IS5 family transposase